MFSLFCGWFRSEASDFEVRFVWKCRCPKTTGFKVRNFISPMKPGAYPFPDRSTSHIVDLGIFHIYYICICQCIWICRCRCIHIYIYICRCTCICICIFLSYEGWLPINHYTQVAWNRPTGAGDQRLQDHGAGAQGLASGKLSGKVDPSDHFIN